MKKLILIFLVTIFAVSTYAASDTGDVNFQDTYITDSGELHLNGAGLRKKFVIKVYAAALYLLEKSETAQSIIEADKPMVIRMVMIYEGVSPEKISKSYFEGFENNMGDIAPYEVRLAELCSWFTEDSKTGDIYDISYEPERGTSLIINGERKGTIQGLDFKKAMFSVWLGESPADKKLKKALLGD